MRKLATPLLLLILAFTFSTIACGDGKEEPALTQTPTPTPTPAYSGGVHTFRVSHQSLPGTIDADMWEYVDEQLQHYTDGQVKLEIFPAGSLYRSLEEFDAISAGGVDMIGIADWIPQMQGLMDWNLASLPFFWGETMDDTLDHDMRFWEHPDGGQKMLIQLEESGIKVMGWIPGSSLTMGLTRDIELESYHDMEGLWAGPYAGRWPCLLEETVGVKVNCPKSGESIIAFEMGLVDIILMSPDRVLNQKLYEACKYGLVLDSVPAHIVISMNLDLWNSLSPELQEIFTTKIIPEVQEWMRENALPYEERCIEELQTEHGMVINWITQEERLELRDKSFDLATQKGYLDQIDADLLKLADHLRSEPYDTGHFFP